MIPEPSHHLPASVGERPFVLRLHQIKEDAVGRFVPAASVEVTPFLRTSGLLASLPAENVKTLLLLLTFVTPNGDIHPTLQELARALRLSSRSMQQRMRQLGQTSWQGKPLVQELRRENGLHAWTPSPHLLATLAAQRNHATSPELPTPSVQSRGRETLLARNRALYTRPRQEVEEDIARRNGWNFPVPQATDLASSRSTTPLTHDTMSDPDLSPEANELRPYLLASGLKALQADMLLARFEPARIRRQLVWLPARGARNPAAFLLSAIEKDYAPPPGSALPPPDTPSSTSS